MWIAPSNRPGAPRAARYFAPAGAVVIAGGAWIAPPNWPGHSRASRYFVSGALSVTADASVPLEVSSAPASIHGIWIAPVNRPGHSRAARYFVAGGPSGSSVAADTAMAAEFRATALADMPLRLDLLGGTRQDGAALVEILGQTAIAAVADSVVPIESLVRAVCNVAAQIENLSIGSVAAGSNRPLPFELTARLVGDAGEPLAWVLSVTLTADPLSLTSGPLEIGSPEPRRAPVPPDISGVRIRLLQGD